MSYGQFPLCWVAAVKVTERSHRLGLWRFLESLMLESLTRLREIKLNYLIHVVHKALSFIPVLLARLGLGCLLGPAQPLRFRVSGKLSFLDGAFFLLPIILYHDGGGGEVELGKKATCMHTFPLTSTYWH